MCFSKQTNDYELDYLLGLRPCPLFVIVGKSFLNFINHSETCKIIAITTTIIFNESWPHKLSVDW